MSKQVERPILFSAPMVRAILEGRKTQTRRIMQVQPPDDGYQLGTLVSSTAPEDRRNCGAHHWIKPGIDMKQSYFRCPYGYNGDRLWVKETWTGTWCGPGDNDLHLVYAADGAERTIMPPLSYGRLPLAATKVGGWVTPLFLPRFASRITLEITNVRVQRLHDISEEDAWAEGIERTGYTPEEFARNQAGDRDVYIASIALADHSRNFPSAREAFAFLWGEINGADSWDENPWVWAVSFQAAPVSVPAQPEGNQEERDV